MEQPAVLLFLNSECEIIKNLPSLNEIKWNVIFLSECPNASLKSKHNTTLERSATAFQTIPKLCNVTHNLALSL